MAKSYNEFIRQRRLSKGLTIEQLAENSHVSRYTISRLELGESGSISLSKLEKIVHALDMEVGDIFKQSSIDDKTDNFFKFMNSMQKKDRQSYIDLFMEIIGFVDNK
ncbi:helix-turn-helix domain-containing protein [Companilactobacillus nuruki]|uniref:Transcriptional regulator n=1 Tax=Companilactobacillus nuruki TaxID=1993540 RepID=A0A2N7AVI6_9LACO|nr:helix-turn-helix transcriptional regulator [Companilactobacillus nuruki]PMD72141.1 transcriptional regulator [Companilactobacillus nuruki]